MEQLDKINTLVKTYKTQISNIKMNKDFVIVLRILHSFIEQNNNLDAKHFIENLLNREVLK